MNAKVKVGMLDKNNHYSPLPQNLSDDEDEYKHGNSNGIEMDRIYNMNHHRVNEENSTPLISVSVRKVMSWPRKVCFLLSVSTAFLAVVSFLWVLPCDVGYTPCRTAKSSKSMPNWNTVMPSKAFRAGLVQLVDADMDGRMDIIIGYRKMNGKISFAEAVETTSYSAGVIVLRGYDGKTIWEQQYYGAPSDIVCHEIDVNQDGVKDCILVGDLGLFSAINISNDLSFWFLHDHAKKKRRPVDVSVPAVVPDLNDDDVDDLVVTCHMGNESCNYCHISSASYMLIISGQTGEIVGGHLLLSNCPVASKPLAVSVNGSIFLVLHCETDDETGAVFVVSAEDLKNYVSENTTDFNDLAASSSLMSLMHRFEGQGSHIHLITDDLDFDKDLDILLIGGNGEVAVYRSSNLNIKWSYQKQGFDIVSYTLGPVVEETYKVVLLTMVLQNCTDNCYTTIIGLSGGNGSVVWSYSHTSIMSPVLLPKSNIWQNLVAFKAFEKSVVNDTNSTMNTSQSEESSESNYETSNEDDKSTAVVAFNEMLIVLNSVFELQHKLLEPSTNMCLGSTKYLPDCLPAFGFHPSGAVGDFDGDQSADLISIKTFLDANSKDSWNLQVTKTNLATGDDTNANSIHHLHTFE